MLIIIHPGWMELAIYSNSIWERGEGRGAGWNWLYIVTAFGREKKERGVMEIKYIRTITL